MLIYNLMLAEEKALNNLLFIVMDWITNLTSNPFRYGFQPYTAMIGNFFYALMFGFIGGAIYMGTGNIGSTLVYFFLVGIFMAMIVPSFVLIVIGLISAMIVTSLLYYTFIAKRSI